MYEGVFFSQAGMLAYQGLRTWACVFLRKGKAVRRAAFRNVWDIVYGLDDTLCNHSFSYAHETSDVGTLDIVDVTISLAAVLNAHVIDVVHDGMEVLVDLFSGPVAVLSVLADFEARGSDATSVDGLARSEGNLSSLDSGDSGRLATHVGDFSNILHAVGEEHLSIFFSEFVLESAGHSDVAFDDPRFLASGEFGLAGEFVGHILNLVAVGSAHDEHVVDHIFGDAVLDFADTVGARDGDDFSAEFNSLGSSTPSDVAEAREGDAFAGEGVAFFADHAVYIVDSAEAGSFRTDEGTTPAVALSGESAGAVLASEFLVSAIEVADFATANSYVTSRAVLVGTDVAPEFVHEGLAEAHDFGVALSDGVEIRTTLTTAEGQHGEAVFEDLLETEEFQHADVNGFVEAETAFVCAEGSVELNAVAEVGANLTLIVDPSHAEGEDTVGLYDALDDFVSLKFGVFVVFFFDGLQDLANGLQVLIFARMFGFQVSHNFVYFHLNQIFMLKICFYLRKQMYYIFLMW